MNIERHYITDSGFRLTIDEDGNVSFREPEPRLSRVPSVAVELELADLQELADIFGQAAIDQSRGAAA